MSKSKMHKQELGKSRPTENRASNAILNEQVNEWLNKVKEAGKFLDGDGVSSSIDRVANVLTSLILQTKQGKCPREVISGLVSRINVQASLELAQKKLTRSNVNVTGKGS